MAITHGIQNILPSSLDTLRSQDLHVIHFFPRCPHVQLSTALAVLLLDVIKIIWITYTQWRKFILNKISCSLFCYVLSLLCVNFNTVCLTKLKHILFLVFFVYARLLNLQLLSIKYSWKEYNSDASIIVWWFEDAYLHGDLTTFSTSHFIVLFCNKSAAYIRPESVTDIL